MKQNKTSNKYLIIILLFGLMILTFNDFGLTRLYKLKKKHSELQQELKHLLLQQNNLRDEISQLQVDEQYIEKIAREKFMMVLPGEKVYRVQEQKQLNINNK